MIKDNIIIKELLTMFYCFGFPGTTPGHDSPIAEEEDCSMLRARLDAECQQLARDLQAAVQELVRPELPLKARAMDELHDYSEIYTPSCENPENRQIGAAGASAHPPPPPIHRYVATPLEKIRK